MKKMKILTILIMMSSLHAKHINKESLYANAFCAYVGGQVEYRIRAPNLRVDCLTSNHAYEVDFGTKTYEGIGQALVYGHYTNRKPGLVLIRESRKDDKLIGVARVITKKYGIELFIIDKNLKINKI